MLYQSQYDAMQQELDDLLDKSAKVERWPARIAKMNLNQKSFCQKSRRELTNFNKWVNGRKEPSWGTIRQVERDLRRFEAALKRARKRRRG